VGVPGQPRRIYKVERNVVIVEGMELPYITIPEHPATALAPIFSKPGFPVC